MSLWPRRVGILGAGAMGSLFAFSLTRNTAAEVWLLSRTPHPGDVEVEGQGRVAVRVSTRPDVPVDLLIVLVKAHATDEAIAQAVAHGAVTEQTIALTLQNGLGNAEILAAYIGPGRTLAGTTAQGATVLGPGRIRHGGLGPTVLAAVGGEPAATRANDVAAYLRVAGFPAEVASDHRPLLWSKLAVSCSINALTAILRVPNGELLQRPGARRLMEAAAREVGAVAAASGIALLEDPVAKALSVAALTAANHSSMRQDVEGGRRTEIEAINGAVAARGKELGVATPVNDVLAELVRSLGG